jgi:hypothetical protein
MPDLTEKTLEEAISEICNSGKKIMFKPTQMHFKYSDLKARGMTDEEIADFVTRAKENNNA